MSSCNVCFRNAGFIKSNDNNLLCLGCADKHICEICGNRYCECSAIKKCTECDNEANTMCNCSNPLCLDCSRKNKFCNSCVKCKFCNHSPIGVEKGICCRCNAVLCGPCCVWTKDHYKYCINECIESVCKKCFYHKCICNREKCAKCDNTSVFNCDDPNLRACLKCYLASF
jgi:hypothetical protein